MSFNFIYVPVSWVMLRWHDLFHMIGFGTDWSWVLSIVFLVITARLLLFGLFIKQVHYLRSMQRMQPKMQKLRDKYRADRSELNRQMIKLQQDEGFNPLSGCLPMVLQIPVFIGLYHVLRHLANAATLCAHNVHSHLLALYTFTTAQTCAASRAQVFKAPLAASFHDSNSLITTLGGDPTSTRWVLIVLLVVSAAATLASQLLARSNATAIPTGTAATVQRLMMWAIPLGVLASGLLFNFPLGVLLYWCTSNLWTLAQHGYINRFHPPSDEPGAAADTGPREPRGGDGPAGPPDAAPRRKPQAGRRPDRRRRRRPRTLRRTNIRDGARDPAYRGVASGPCPPSTS